MSSMGKWLIIVLILEVKLCETMQQVRTQDDQSCEAASRPNDNFSRLEGELFDAIEQLNYAEVVNLLLENASPNARSVRQLVGLRFNENSRIFKPLALYFAPSVSHSKRTGSSCLAVAALYGGFSILQKLLEKGACVEEKHLEEDEIVSPLMCAVVCGDLEAVKLLLAHKAPVNYGGTCGFSPLMAAFANNHPKIVEELLRQGASTTFCDHKGRSVCYYQKDEGPRDVVSPSSLTEN